MLGLKIPSRYFYFQAIFILKTLIKSSKTLVQISSSNHSKRPLIINHILQHDKATALSFPFIIHIICILDLPRLSFPETNKLFSPTLHLFLYIYIYTYFKFSLLLLFFIILLSSEIFTSLYSTRTYRDGRQRVEKESELSLR